MRGPYSRNHVASAGYLAAWAGVDATLRAVQVGAIESRAVTPRGAGWRDRYWGRDRDVRRHVEQLLSRAEDHGLRALAELREHRSLTRGTVAHIAAARFLALHVHRAPGAREHSRRLQEAALRRGLGRYGLSEDERFDFLRWVTSDTFHAYLVLDQLRSMTMFLGSMHWCLLSFDAPVLATSDQPVTVVPLLDAGATAPVRVVPAAGMTACEEVRFAVSPRQALVLTWLDEPDDESCAVAGDDWIAAMLNRAVIGQADHEWFHHPGRRPTTLVAGAADRGLCEPVGRRVHGGAYDAEAARASRRYREAQELVQDVVERRDEADTVVVSVARG